LGVVTLARHVRAADAVNPFLRARNKPLVVGHRGTPRLHQENTLAGFRRAAELGFGAVELDVRLTKDGRVVVFHDSDLRRLCGVPRPVIDLTWDELAKLRITKRIDVGRNERGEQVVIDYEHEEPIALFEEVLAELSDRLAFNVELKLDDVWWPHWWRTEIATRTAEVVAMAGAGDRVIFTSFDPRKLRAVSRVLPDAAVGFCWDETMLNFASPLLERLPAFSDHETDDRFHGNARRFLNRLVDANIAGRLLGTRVLGVEHTLVGRDSVRRLHARGVAIGTHVLFPLGSTTGKSIAPSAMRDDEVLRLVALGVDWIESDDPERVRALAG
jgi:glycerophosphoryl diester phosphodiesterase